MKKILLISGIAIAIIALAQIPRPTGSNEVAKTVSPTNETAINDNDVKRTYYAMHKEAIVNANIPGFYNYYFTKIEPACPFYEPDGASYRGCLTDLVEKRKIESKRSSSEIDTISTYCKGISDEYNDGLEAVELYLDCMLFIL